jgi:hypothetical protein
MKYLVGLALASAMAVALGCGGDGSCPLKCNDGWCSHAENRQGACSSHGGIAEASPNFANRIPTAPTQ